MPRASWQSRLSRTSGDTDKTGHPKARSPKEHRVGVGWWNTHCRRPSECKASKRRPTSGDARRDPEAEHSKTTRVVCSLPRAATCAFVFFFFQCARLLLCLFSAPFEKSTRSVVDARGCRLPQSSISGSFSVPLVRRMSD